MSNQYLIVNFDRKEYLRPGAFGERDDLKTVLMSSDGVLTALAIVLADGNNRGGGDLRSDMPIIGSWAGQRIGIVDDLVVDAMLSEPGMESIPLQQQMLQLGKDVSGAAIEALLDGERSYSIMDKLNPNLCLTLVQQREMPGDGASYFKDDASRKGKRLEELQQLFWLFGVEAGLTPFMARKRLQEGLQKMAASLGRGEHYEVDLVDFEYGSKKVQMNPYAREKSTFQGVVAMVARLRDVTRDGTEVNLHVAFGPRGRGSCC